jgi:hypothetical protein
MNTQNLTIYDFVVDLIPGLIAILLFTSLLPTRVVDELNITDITLGSSLLVIVIGYFVGHLIQAVASPIDNWVYLRWRDDYPFEEALKQAEENSVKGRFKDSVDSFFALDADNPDKLNGFERFKLTQSYVWNNNIGRAKRFQILYTFLRSMWVLLVVGALLHLIALIATYRVGYSLLWTPLQSGVIIVVLFLAGCVSLWRRIQYHDEMAEALIFDFHANVLSDN